LDISYLQKALTHLRIVDFDIFVEIVHHKITKTSTHVEIFTLIFLDLEDFESRTHAAVKHELNICQIHYPCPVEVEEVEKEAYLLEKLRLGKNRKSSEELKCVY
jgi:hypothetical protein